MENDIVLFRYADALLMKSEAKVRNGENLSLIHIYTDLPRFMSEFGFQSFPEMKTIATFAAPGDYQIESEVMNAHQKSSICLLYTSER